MVTEVKKLMVSELKNEFKEIKHCIVANFSGMSSKQMSELYAYLRSAGLKAKVVKNSLAKIALDGLDISGIAQFIKLNTIILYAKDGDGVELSRKVCEFAKKNENRPLITGGYVAKKILNSNEIRQIAELPPVEVIYAKLFSSMKNPISRFVICLKGVVSKFIIVLKQIEQKNKNQTT